MLRRGLVASFLMVLCFTFVTAEEIKGKITKIDDKSVSISTSKDDKEGKAYTLAKDCKFSKLVKKTKEDLKDGVKSEEFKATTAKKGLTGSIITNDKNEVTEVIVGGKKKKAT